jgi:hypothetical protein
VRRLIRSSQAVRRLIRERELSARRSRLIRAVEGFRV